MLKHPHHVPQDKTELLEGYFNKHVELLSHI